MLFRPYFLIEFIQSFIRLFLRNIHAVVDDPPGKPFIYVHSISKSRKFLHPLPSQVPVGLAGIIPSSDNDDLRAKSLFIRRFHIIKRGKEFSKRQVSGSSEYGKCLFFIHGPAPNRGGIFRLCRFFHTCALQSSLAAPGSDWLLRERP